MINFLEIGALQKSYSAHIDTSESMIQLTKLKLSMSGFDVMVNNTMCANKD